MTSIQHFQLTIMNFKKYFVGLSLCTLSIVAHGQEKGIGNDETEVIKNFKAQLEDRDKINRPASIPDDSNNQNTNLDYEVTPRLLNLDYEAPKIKPLAFSSPEQEAGSKFYSKIGFGMPIQPYAELSYYTHTYPWSLGAAFKHHSIDNSSNIPLQKNGKTNIALGAKHYFLDFSAAANLNYERANHNYYSPNRFSLVDLVENTFLDDENQTFNKIGLDAAFENITDNDLGINYDGNINAWSLTDSYDAKEFAFFFNGNGSKKIFQKHLLDLNIGFNTTSLNASNSQNISEFTFNPAFIFNTAIVTSRLGFNVDARESFIFSPDIAISAQLAGEKAVLFAKWFEDAPNPSFDYIRTVNPFTVSNPLLIHGYQEKRQLGLKGGIQKLQYELSGYQAPLRDLMTFVSSSEDMRRFETSYDDGSMINAHFGATVTPNTKTKVYLIADYNKYDLKNQEAAWLLPTVEANIGSQIQVTPKISADIEGYFGAGIDYLNISTQETKTLNPLFDINLGGHYRINKHFGAFIDLNNILNNKRERFNGYETVGLNFLGGTTIKY